MPRNCQNDEEINPDTGRCRKKCRPDQIRNPDTGRCVKADGPIGRRLQGLSPPMRRVRTRRPCREDQERNPTNQRCRKKCLDHQERNPATGRCRGRSRPPSNGRPGAATVRRQLGMTPTQAFNLLNTMPPGPHREEFLARLQAIRAGRPYAPPTDDVYDDNRCRAEGVVRYPACDGKEDPIMLEPIPRNAGVCAKTRCYDAQTLVNSIRRGHLRDPYTRQWYTQEQVRLLRRIAASSNAISVD